MYKLALVLALLLLTITVWGQADENEDIPFFQADEGALIIAHQGGDALRPSNTMAAFEHALALGADVLEMDIHSTADDVLVVIHDATVDRTTDGTGRVNDLTFDEIQALDAGYNWPTLGKNENPPDVTGNPYRGEGVTIPALEDVFATFPDMRMVIEIKQAEPSIAAPFCDMLHDYAMTEQVVVASFSADAMTEFRETCPDVATSGVEDEIRTFIAISRFGSLDNYEGAAQVFQVPEFAGEVQVVTPEFVEAAHSVGIDVHVWTVNVDEDMQRLLDMGVDGIITDYPDVLRDVLGREPGL